MGTVTGMYVDKEDHIWVLEPPGGKLQDPGCAGVRSRGQPDQVVGTPESAPEGVWPRQVHTIFTDRDKNVWIAGAAPGDTLVKFSPDGEVHPRVRNRGPIVERRA
jgi:sugar lactone lactonase YvrE